ncbi:MAG: hypothetical protein OEX81_04135 [Candidatus Pacebacteria bacterium]|nr:hypothetical protein [Candidatus Paceibacterota bacterium]
MARRIRKEIEMPEWVTEGAKIAERALEEERVLVPVRQEEAKHQAYRYANVAEDDKPWYLQNESQSKDSEETWASKSVQQLADYVSEMILIKGNGVDVDQLVNGWLESHTEIYRAILIGLLTEEEARQVFLSKNLNQGVVNSVVQLIFS